MQPRTKQIRYNGQENGSHGIKAIEKNKFGVFREVPDQMQARGHVLSAAPPQHMTVPETVLHRRMWIFSRLGMGMVMTVMRRPPQRPALTGSVPQKSQDKLHETRGLVGAV